MSLFLKSCCQIYCALLSPKWGAAVVPLRLLPLAMPITVLSPFLNAAFQRIGKTHAVLKSGSVMPIALSCLDSTTPNPSASRSLEFGQ